ncbi:hypothetical protein PSYPI_47356, partial [Pseudomonas syringae pv. pisi str. 1704B]
MRAQADYRPECAWQAHSSSKPVLPARGFTRPGWLLREPQPLT